MKLRRRLGPNDPVEWNAVRWNGTMRLTPAGRGVVVRQAGQGYVEVAPDDGKTGTIFLHRKILRRPTS